MVLDREATDSLVSLGNLAAQLAVRDLIALLGSLPVGEEERRAVLLEAIPLIVEKYGSVAAVGAEEWYQRARDLYVSGSYSTVLGEPVESAAIAYNVRAVIGPLFDGELAPDVAMSQVTRRLSEVVERSVKYNVRSTVLANAVRDKAAVKFARVPAGAETCKFCLMLASRGWVYATKASASRAKSGNSFHAGCDCVVVPSFGANAPTIAGYDPDAIYESLYRAA